MVRVTTDNGVLQVALSNDMDEPIRRFNIFLKWIYENKPNDDYINIVFFTDAEELELNDDYKGTMYPNPLRNHEDIELNILELFSEHVEDPIIGYS